MVIVRVARLGVRFKHLSRLRKHAWIVLMVLLVEAQSSVVRVVVADEAQPLQAHLWPAVREGACQMAVVTGAFETARARDGALVAVLRRSCCAPRAQAPKHTSSISCLSSARDCTVSVSRCRQ